LPKNFIKKKREFDIGISFPKIFWHLETKKKELPIIQRLFLKKLAQILQYSEEKKGMSLSNLDHSFL
jgi:hypothetical protein